MFKYFPPRQEIPKIYIDKKQSCNKKNGSREDAVVMIGVANGVH